ncbi:MAG: hypothetical protein ACFFDN_02270 [Candidatus Hodarchaeota archaeon]
MKYRKILYAIDGTEGSIESVKQVWDIQRKWKSKIIILLFITNNFLLNSPTVTTLVPMRWFLFNSPYLKIMKKEEGNLFLKKFKKLITDDEESIESHLIIDENPEDYINRIINKDDIDLVILSLKEMNCILNDIFVNNANKDILNNYHFDILIAR